MLRFHSCLLIACVTLGIFSQHSFAAEPHEVWLQALVGTWTWKDSVRGDVTVTFQRHDDAACLVGTGKDETGSFVAIVGWEAATKSLTDTGFHSNGGNARIVYNDVAEATLKGVQKSSGPGGKPQLDSTFQVVRKGDTLTVTTTDSKGESSTTVISKEKNAVGTGMTKVEQEVWETLKKQVAKDLDKDWEGMGKYIHPSACFWGDNLPHPVSASPETIDYYAALRASEGKIIAHQLIPVSVVVVEDVAIVNFYGHAIVEGDDDERKEQIVRGHNTWKKENGRWLLLSTYNTMVTNAVGDD